MPTLVACLWRCVEATQLGRVPTHFGPATRLRRPESPWNQGALATSQVEMCPRTANSGLARPARDQPQRGAGDAQRQVEAGREGAHGEAAALRRRAPDRLDAEAGVEQ